MIVCALMGLVSLAGAVDFKIESLGRDKQYAWMGNTWNEGAECIELRFSASEQTAAGVFYRAYLYDKDNKLVHTVKEPTQIFNYAYVNKSSPPVLEPGKKYSVYFAIPEEFMRGEKKWKRAVVVFGAGDNVVGDVFPKDAIRLFDFPEKSKLK